MSRLAKEYVGWYAVEKDADCFVETVKAGPYPTEKRAREVAKAYNLPEVRYAHSDGCFYVTKYLE